MITLVILRVIWELPQNILGFAVWLFVRKKIRKTEALHDRLFFNTPAFGVSLGSFVFYSEAENPYVKINVNNKQHEFGHTIQSMIFGPLYLALIGLPSIARVIYSLFYFKKHKKIWQHYYDGYPENQADALGSRYY